jgi:membrane associated rhomboid family serine protease
MKYIDDESKKLKWYNRNVVYVGTLCIVFINIFAFWFGGNDWAPNYVWSDWKSILNFQNLIACFLSAYEHSNLQHCLLNSLCFLIAGCYVERKIGTVNLLVLTFAITFFCGCAVNANSNPNNHGFSGVNYGIYAYIIVDYIFMFVYKKQTKINVIYGAIILTLIYVAACFCGGTSNFAFAPYPYDLIANKGHYTSFAAGAILFLLLQFVKFQTYSNQK